MPEEKLLKVTLILPRNEASEAISKITELEWFHSIQKESHYSNPEIDDLLLRAQKVFQSIDEVARALEIPLEVGIMETMFKGPPKFDTSFTVASLEELVSDLELKSKPIIEEIKAILTEHASVSKELEENKAVRDILRVVSNITLGLDAIKRLKRFYASMFVVDSKSVNEIERSLEGLLIIKLVLNEADTALVIIGGADDAERVIKVMRSFDKHPFSIPPALPQNPSEAYAIVSAKVSELEKRKAELEASMVKMKVNVRTKIISLYEGSKVAKDVLELMRKPSGTKNFALIQGFIPSSMEDKIRKLSNKWVCITENSNNEHSEHPILLKNSTYIKTFEVITNTQGIPKPREIDPTPFIAFVWPVFYGLMFGDLGHGILLFLLGMLFRVRGLGNLRTWGTLVAASGLAAAVAGLGTGEFFGFHIEEVALLKDILQPLHGIIGIIAVSELTFEQVSKILEISIAIGVGHIAMAFILRIIKDYKEGRKHEASMIGIPTLIMYGCMVSLILAAIGASYDVIGMFGVTSRVHDEAVPWITPIVGEWATVEVVAKAVVPILFGSMAMVILGHHMEEKRLKKEGKHVESAGMVGLIMEVMLIKLVEMLSNTISYSRIAIMLLVHAILLLTINHGYESLSLAGNFGGGIVMLVGGNIGIMMIEGLIVYIQAIRLHLYEWFPKWYEGTGVQFRKLVPKMIYTSITWKNPDSMAAKA